MDAHASALFTRLPAGGAMFQIIFGEPAAIDRALRMCFVHHPFNCPSFTTNDAALHDDGVSSPDFRRVLRTCKTSIESLMPSSMSFDNSPEVPRLHVQVGEGIVEGMQG